MADNRIAGLNAITEINTALDFLPIVDVSDPQMANSGTTKKITINQILGAGTNVVVPAGTAGSPSISFSGDSNTGIYAPAADQLSISSGGSGNATVSSTGLSVTGSVSATSTITGTQLISTVAIGTAPLSITSTTVVSNLNADLLDGQHGSFYRDADNITAGTLAVTRGGTGVTTSTGTGSVVLSISPTLSGTPVSTTAVADTNTTQIATTAYVIGQASSTTPAALGSANVGTSLKYARADHVHPLPTIDLAAGVTGTLPVGSGGTGLSTYAVGDLIYASAATTLAKLASVASGSVLVSGGVATAPSWGKVELDLHVSKQLPVSNGGTGASTFTAGRVLFGNGTSALNTSSNLFWDNGNNRLGIATATPATKLHINGEVALPLSNLIYWNAYYGTGSFRSIAAGKSGYIATLADGSLQFSNTTDSAASADQSISFSERLRIASNGVCTWSNVVNAGTAMTLNGTGLGIGTATPSVALDVNGSAYFRASSAILGAGTPFEWISTYPNRTQAYQSSGNDFEINNISSGGFRLYLNSTERLRIASDGVCTWSNVGGVANTAMTLNGTGLGIGTATISERLTVSGNVLATDSAGTYPRFISTVGAKSWEIGYRSGTTNYELREDGTTRLVVANGGNVGIGTTSPAYKLDVLGAIASNNGTIKTGISYGSNGVIGTFSNHNLSIITNDATVATFTTSGNLGLSMTPNTWAAVFRAIQFPDGYAAIAGDNGNGVAEITSNAYNDGAWKFRNAQGAVRYRLDAINKTHTWFNTSTTPTANGAITWTPAMALDALGNLGLGVTPSAWISSYRAFNIGDSGLISSRTGASINNVEIGVNWFRNTSGSFVYKANGYSTNYQQFDGYHYWYNAASGTAGNTITFTPAMTLDASGNLALGTSTANFRADIQNASGAAILRLKGGTGAAQGSAVYMTYAGSANTLLGIGDRATILGGTPDQLACIYSGVALTFEVNGVERIRFKSTGQVNFVGLASDPAGAAGDVYYNSTSSKLKFYDSAWKTIPASDQVSAANGTVGAPSISFESDTNTGIYRSAADTLHIATGGVAAVRVNPNGSFGYAVSVGGAVEQATSRTTGVTLNKACGAITLVSAAGSTSWQTFTVTNNTVDATDVVKVCQKSGTDIYQIHVTNVLNGSFKISFATTGGTTTEQPVFNFAVIKAGTGDPV